MTDISNFPIKYVIQPVYKFKGDRLPYGYIITKAFIVRELIDYREDSINYSYTVVFPVTRYTPTQDILKINKPDFRSYNICKNVDVVHEIFDTYDEAIKIRDISNELLVLQYYPNENVDKRKSDMKIWEEKVLGNDEVTQLGTESKIK